MHVRQARAGDAASVSWLVERFSPALLAQARYRLGSKLRRVCDAEDLVADVWVVALPKLSEVGDEERRLTPALMRFLSTTLAYRLSNLLQRYIAKRQGGSTASARQELADLPASTTGAISVAMRNERCAQLLAAIDRLDQLDRDIVVLRGIEQQPNDEVAAKLGMEPNTVSHRFRRALHKLRDRLRGTVFDELDADRS